MSTWQIDTSHSSITFRVRHMMFAKVRGHFGKWTGSLTGTADQLGHASTTVTIDASSIDTGTADRDTHLRSPDFLDVAQFPTITFTSTGVKVAGDALTISGDLTIRDATRPITLTAERTGEGKDPWGNARLGFSGHTRLSRKDFGLVWNQLLETGGAVVGDDIDVEVDVEVLRPAG
jgi:polyisoprenoid-binding protein YceI